MKTKYYLDIFSWDSPLVNSQFNFYIIFYYNITIYNTIYNITVIARHIVENYSVSNFGRIMSSWSIHVCVQALSSSTSTKTLPFSPFGSICFWLFTLGADELQMLDSDKHLDLIWRFMSSFIDFHYLFLTICTNM